MNRLNRPNVMTNSYFGKDNEVYVEYIDFTGNTYDTPTYTLYKANNGKLMPASGMIELPFGSVSCVDGWFHKECGYAFTTETDGNSYYLDGQLYEKEKEYCAELLRRGKERNDEAVIQWCMAKTLGSNNEP